MKSFIKDNKVLVAIISVIVTVFIFGVKTMITAQMERDKCQEENIIDLQKEKVDNETMQQMMILQKDMQDKQYEELKSLRQQQLEIIKRVYNIPIGGGESSGGR